MTIALVYMRHAFSQENRDYHIIRRTENISSQITVTKLESSHSPQVPPPRQSYSPGGVTIFGFAAVSLCPL